MDSQENLPKLFNEIVQFNAGKLQNGGGSGFGLWITKSIVDLHEGRVFAHSEGEGTGCTFTVDLPAHVEEPAPVPLEASYRSSSMASRNSVRDSLLHDAEYHVVFMDHQMPNMDGPTAAKAMRDLGYKGVIIGVTGNASAADTDIFLSHGANKVLTKPVSIAMLEKALSGTQMQLSNKLTSLPLFKHCTCFGVHRQSNLAFMLRKALLPARIDVIPGLTQGCF